MHQRWQMPRQQKNPRRAEGFSGSAVRKSAEADLGQDALAGQELGAEADHDAQHGQTTVPGLSEVDEAEACVVRHGEGPIWFDHNVTKVGVLLRVLTATRQGIHSHCLRLPSA